MLDASDMPAAVLEHFPPGFVLTQPPQGETSEVVFVEAPGHKGLVVKRSIGPIYAPWIKREAHVLAAISNMEVPVPDVLAQHVGRDDCGEVHWLVMTRIAGQNVWPALLAANRAERLDLLHQLGNTLGRIHATPIPAYFDDEPDATPWLERHRLSAQEISLDDDLVTSFGDTTSEVRTLIHGDFTLDNVLIDDGQISGVIDWSGAGAGDPRFDITLALATSPELPLEPADLSAFFEGYVQGELPSALRSMVQALYGC